MTPSPFRRLPGAPSLSHKGRGTASLRLFEHVLRVLRGGRQAHRITLDIGDEADGDRSEEHTSELQSLMRISYAVFCLKKKKYKHMIAHHESTELSMLNRTIRRP